MMGTFPCQRDVDALNPGEKCTVSGLGNMGGTTSVASDVTQRSLTVNKLKWLLDKLSDRDNCSELLSRKRAFACRLR